MKHLLRKATVTLVGTLAAGSILAGGAAHVAAQPSKPVEAPAPQPLLTDTAAVTLTFGS